MNLLHEIFQSISKQSLRGLMLCMAWLVIAPVHAEISETAANDVFHDLTDVSNNFDLSEAMIGQNDVFRGAIGLLETTTAEDVQEHGFEVLQFDDIDFWTFDLHPGTDFRADFVGENDVQIPGGQYHPAAVLYQYIDGVFNPVAGNGTNSQRTVFLRPWQAGRYFFGISGSNNHAISAADVNLGNSSHYATEASPRTNPLARFNGLGQTTFTYRVQFQGVFEPTPLPAGASAVPLPSALWLFMSGLLGLGLLKRKAA